MKMSLNNTFTETVDVNVPVRFAYDQWTQFEEFPRFMEGVENITQITPDMIRWNVNILGVRREFDTEITEQSPDKRIAWRTVTGPYQAGVVTFHKISDDETRVTLQMDYEPEGFFESAAEKLGLVGRQLATDMENFRKFIEARDIPTGGWRGEIEKD